MTQTMTPISPSNTNYQEVLARCFVAMSEVDYDLNEWRKSVTRPLEIMAPETDISGE